MFVQLRHIFFKYFRSKRLRQFKELFPEQNCSTVLDLGGSTYQWDLLGYGGDITILNLQPPTASSKRSNYTHVVADALNAGFPDQSFDLVFSNSVIEHVGDYADQATFAQEMVRMGKQVYCQTPNKNFFVEPHLIAPFIHYFPMKWQLKLARYCSLWGIVKRPSATEIKELLSSIRLLTKKELQELFPDCEIVTEDFSASQSPIS